MPGAFLVSEASNEADAVDQHPHLFKAFLPLLESPDANDEIGVVLERPGEVQALVANLQVA